MYKKTYFLFFAFFLIVIPSTLSILREGDCNANETCLFSLYQNNNSHFGACNYYNKSVCIEGVYNVYIKEGSCDSGFILSLHYPNNTHVSSTENYFNYSLCADGIECSINNECIDTKVVSLYKSLDSHLAEPEYYNRTLCCGRKGEVGGGGGASYASTVTKEDYGKLCNSTLAFFNQYHQEGNLTFSEENLTKLKNDLAIKFGRSFPLSFLDYFFRNYYQYCPAKEEIQPIIPEEKKKDYWWVLLVLIGLILLFFYLEEEKRKKKVKLLILMIRKKLGYG